EIDVVPAPDVGVSLDVERAGARQAARVVHRGARRRRDAEDRDLGVLGRPELAVAYDRIRIATAVLGDAARASAAGCTLRVGVARGEPAAVGLRDTVAVLVDRARVAVGVVAAVEIAARVRTRAGAARGGASARTCGRALSIRAASQRSVARADLARTVERLER